MSEDINERRQQLEADLWTRIESGCHIFSYGFGMSDWHLMNEGPANQLDAVLEHIRSPEKNPAGFHLIARMVLVIDGLAHDFRKLYRLQALPKQTREITELIEPQLKRGLFEKLTTDEQWVAEVLEHNERRREELAKQAAQTAEV